MEQQIVTAHDLFPHIRIVLGMVIGLGVARLLSGIARIIQHPKQYPLYPVHLAWAASVLLMLAHFWWWEFGLFRVDQWTFGKYLFLIGYAVALFLLCALLFPESLLDYRSYEQYFYERRAWFFGVLAAIYVIDIGDTLLKGDAHLASFGIEYLIRTPLIILLCIVAMFVNNRRFHVSFVGGKLLYQFWWITRFFDTIV
ncbi:hypothetical protein M2281_001242 [Mesorhizobium soli]|nr:hypothetical protein [Mesorhizobium soli]MDH6230670.1 hypothetical protein [Mesorhizobium soli]